LSACQLLSRFTCETCTGQTSTKQNVNPKPLRPVAQLPNVELTGGRHGFGDSAGHSDRAAGAGRKGEMLRFAKSILFSPLRRNNSLVHEEEIQQMLDYLKCAALGSYMRMFDADQQARRASNLARVKG
jgi:hypothetical protein